MKLIITSLQNGNLQHDEVKLPDRYLGLSLELSNGTIFQIDTIEGDVEETLEIREATFRHLTISPRSTNTLHLKGGF